MSRSRLILAIHDVSPLHRDRISRIEAFLANAGIGDRYALFVVPDFWRRAPLQGDADFQSWLRRRARAGVEIFLHGFFHRDESVHCRAFDRWRARHMTAGEAEFLGLSYEEAHLRISRGKEIIEATTGMPISGFVAPAWLYGQATRRVLADLKIPVSENQFCVWSPALGRVLMRTPVISYASRSAGRIRSSIAWSQIASFALARFGTMRIGLHPGDFDVPEITAEAGRAIGQLMRVRAPSRYADLLPRQA